VQLLKKSETACFIALLTILLCFLIHTPVIAQGTEFRYSGQAEADGRETTLQFIIIGNQVTGSMVAKGVKGPNIFLQTTNITLKGTLTGTWEGTGRINGTWTGGDYGSDGNLIPGWPTSGNLEIYLTADKKVRLVRRDLATGYGYVFRPRGIIFSGGPAQPGNWTGTWKTDFGTMVLTQTGNSVTGSYTHEEGRVSGAVQGNTLTGTWSQKQSKTGRFKFTMSADGRSFRGLWGLGSQGPISSGWNGTRQ